MEKAQVELIAALKYSIQMEVDGKKFYIISGESSSNKIGKDLFAWLAGQEDFHKKRFEDIYNFLIEKKVWPSIKISPVTNISFKTIFGEALLKSHQALKPQQGDFSSANKAIEMEVKCRDYYREQADSAKSEIAKQFFNSISNEEQGHYLALVDYIEYIKDPVGGFTRTEHHSLDDA